MWDLKKYKSKIDNKVKDLIFKNALVRRLRNFINLSILPYLAKFIITIVVVLILSFVGLKVFKPQILDSIYRKSSYYLQHYLNLDRYRFASIKIKGAKRSDENEIIKIIRKTSRSHNSKVKDNSLIKKIADNLKKEQGWINKINVFRTLPNQLNVDIVEYVPFAIWQDGDKKYIIDREGNKVQIESYGGFEHLIVLSGKKANLNVKTLFNILAISPEVSSRVYSATWVGSRRWDIRFENGLLIKLPENNLEEAWQRLIKIYRKKGSLYNLKIIDLRIEQKTYLEYKSKK